MKRLVFLVLFLCGIFVVNVAVSASEDVSNSIFLEEIEDMNKSIKVIMELNYSITETEIDSNSYFLEDLKEIRARNKEYHTEKNENFIEENNLSDFGLTMSSYSPFLFKSYDTYEEYESDRQVYSSLIASTNSINKIYVGNEDFHQEEVEVATTPDHLYFTLEEAKKTIQIQDSIYTGFGIKIGIIDQGYPINSSNLPKDFHVFSDISEKERFEHPMLVASILGGKYGIAPDAELYFGSYYYAERSLEWMLDEGVHVVNCSFNSGDDYGIYSGCSAYFDYNIRVNLISVVCAAGNNYTSKLVVNPGMGLNTLTVGSINKSRSVSNFSCYKFDEKYENIILKPNVVAPGENLLIPNFEDLIDGTSFSAPMVTGMLAVLMEEFEILTIRPNLGVTAIMSGASWLPGQTEVMDKAAGAGLINYKATQKLLQTNNYNIGTLHSWEAFIGKKLLICDIIVSAHCQADFFFMSLSDSSVTNYTYSEVPLKFTKYKIEVYDDNDESFYEGIMESNIKGFHFVNDTSYDQRYNFIISLADDMVSSNTEVFGTSYQVY